MSSHEHHHHDGHTHHHTGGIIAWVKGIFGVHSHDSIDQIDNVLEGSREGIRALKISLVVLGITAIGQAVVVVLSGSVALLGDTLHNFADALTALPLWVAFTLSRRAPDERYTYGYGRAEDIAGIAIVLAIAASAVLAGYEAIQRLVHPVDVRNLGLVALAAGLGFAGNEVAAQYRLRTGRRIGSAALVADGLHARTDGLTSLAVLVGAGGVALGFERADPIVGLFITLAIVVVLRGAARTIYYRLMDAVSPELVEEARNVVVHVPGVQRVDTLRLRWVGHQLHAEVEVTVADNLSLERAHGIANDAHHQLLHHVGRLTTVIVHPSPAGHPGVDPHAVLREHAAEEEQRQRRRAGQ
ncbi:MAG TPA: cation diffusion facilitator family transporter [Acidimicrobiia bacterium]